MSKNTYHKRNNDNGNGIIMNEYDEYCWTKKNAKGSIMNKKNEVSNVNKAENQMYQINKPRPSLNNNVIDDNEE